VTKNWDQLPGERKIPYKKFLAFVDLGPSRSIPELARRLSVTPDGLYYLLKKYDWLARAEAWDVSGGIPGSIAESDDAPQAMPSPPPPPPKPRRTRTPKPPPPPEPIDLNKAVEPEIVDTIKTAVPQEYADEMSVYRDSFKAKGLSMLSMSDKAQELAEIAHADLQKSWELRKKALEVGDIAAANLYCRSILDMTPCFWRYCEAVRGLANDASTHWGNATGISELLKRVYG
jgi:hypothetical protein